MTLLVQFLSQLRTFVRQQDGQQLRSWLQVEPNASQTYYDLATELRKGFSQDFQDGNALDGVLEKSLPEDHDVSEGEATPWPSFVAFVKDYLIFWRDANFENLLDTHTKLSGLVNSCGAAFTHPMYGSILLQTAMSLCETLSRLTMMVNRRPELTTELRNIDSDEDKPIAEVSAEIIQKVFTTCLTERGGGHGDKPEGKKVGVYMFANLVLKLLFACRRTHLAKQIFTNISTASPPLSKYPAAQRVTFLYYLGRFNLSNSHFVRAALCLERAYLETPPQLVSHRHAVLAYLIPANLLLGRLPSPALLSRPEASDRLSSIFTPLSTAIRRGDFILFQHTLETYEDWLFERSLLVFLTYRLRPLLWRSLARRTFLLTWAADSFDDDPNATARKAATLELADLLTAATYLQRCLQGWRTPPRRNPPSHVSRVFMQAVANDTPSTLVPPDGNPKKLRPNQGLLYGDAEVTLADVEMMVASLVMQGLMRGYIAHSSGRFAIMGAAKRGPVVAGWPTPWSAVQERAKEDGETDLHSVPGWVKG